MAEIMPLLRRGDRAVSEFRTALRRVRVKDGATVEVLRPQGVPSDIASQLRRTADEIERGELDCDMMVAVLNTDEGIQIYGWGKHDGARAAALLTMGAHKFNGMVLDWAERDGGRAL